MCSSAATSPFCSASFRTSSALRTSSSAFSEAATLLAARHAIPKQARTARTTAAIRRRVIAFLPLDWFERQSLVQENQKTQLILIARARLERQDKAAPAESGPSTTDFSGSIRKTQISAPTSITPALTRNGATQKPRLNSFP